MNKDLNTAHQSATLRQRWMLVLIALVIFSGFAFTPDKAVNDNKIRSIMIDAGHGGHDPGTLGTKRYEKSESDIALDVSLKLGKYIEENIPDVKVLYTRKDDRFHKLHERTKMANRAGVDLFISIHCNSNQREGAFGCESYVMGPAKSEANMKTAQKENAAMLKEKDYETSYGGFDPYSPESYIELMLRQNAFVEQSLSFSGKVQNQFRDRIGRKDRGVKQAPFWVISHTTMPSTLIELGFLTNKDEEDFLHSENGQDYMASAIYRAFKHYRSELEGLKYNEVDEPAMHEPVVDVVPSQEIIPAPVEREKELPADDKIYFKVQLTTTTNPVDIKPDNFKGLQEVDYYISNGLYKYTFGNEKRYKKARDLQLEAQSVGYEGCFVIAMQNGERVDLRTAIDKTGD